MNDIEGPEELAEDEPKWIGNLRNYADFVSLCAINCRIELTGRDREKQKQKTSNII